MSISPQKGLRSVCHSALVAAVALMLLSVPAAAAMQPPAPTEPPSAAAEGATPTATSPVSPTLASAVDAAATLKAQNATQTATAQATTATSVELPTGTSTSDATATAAVSATVEAAATLTAVRATQAAATLAAAAQLTREAQPTATPVPTNTPLAPTATRPPAAPPTVPAGNTEPPVRSGLSRYALLGGILVAAALALGLLALFLLRRRGGASNPPSVSPVPPVNPASPMMIPTNGGATPAQAPAALTATRPQPGVPYLESQGRPSGVVYYPLTRSRITVGRGTENDLVIDGSFAGWQTVSRSHAVIEDDGQRAVLVDCGTPNGIEVNGRRTGVNVLRDGMTISLGQVKFSYRDNRGGGQQ